jgi:hypothetical protein
MNFYLINPYFELFSEMEDSGVTGNLLTYHSKESDYFIKVARDIDVHKKIKYMVAIRPHVLSPEYLVRINKSIKEISNGDRLQINLVSGDINDAEYEMDRTLGTTTNKSTNKERSDYLIEYIELLNKLPEKEKPDYYVSVTNDFTFQAASKYNDKMIIPYYKYIHNNYDLTNRKVMIYLAPIMRKTQEELNSLTGYNLNGIVEDVRYTYEKMTNLVNQLEDQGIKEMMLSSWNDEDTKINLNFIREYNYNKGKNSERH